MPPRKKANGKKRHLATVGETAAALIEEQRLEQAMEARELRRDGHDWWEIANKMRLTPRDARQAVAYGIRAAAELVNDATKIELLDLELSRLDLLIKANMPEAMKGNTQSGKLILDVVKERVRLLELDKEHTQAGQTTVVVGGTSTEYIEALQTIAAYAQQGHQTVAGELESGEEQASS